MANVGHVKKACIVATVRHDLSLCDKTRGKHNKKRIATRIMNFVTHPARQWFMLQHLKFFHTVLDKLIEFYYETAFTANEPINWLRQLYANPTLRQHMQGATDVVKDGSTCSIPTLIQRDPLEEGCWCRVNCYESKFSVSEFNEPNHCEACNPEAPHARRQAIVNSAKRLVKTYVDANLNVDAHFAVGQASKKEYEALTQRSKFLPAWYLAVEYVSHDGTFGPYEH